MSELIYLGQVFFSMILGSLIGLQRERWGKPAGPRTHALVAAGATLFTILSLHAFGPNEMGRVASNIVVGIGFLGAGIIYHNKEEVQGLTTAAGLWTAAAIGMAIGAEQFILAAGTTILMLILLTLDDSRFRKRKEK